MSFTYEQYDVLHNFISPITGRILSDPNYVLIGNKNGIAIPSPIIIDIRLDLIALRKRYNTLVKGDFVIGHPNNELPNAQVLFNMPDGFLYNTEGVVSTTSIIPIGGLPDLPYKNIWIGDNTNRPVPNQRVALYNLPSFRTLNPFNNFGIYGLYTGQFLSLTSPLDIAQPTTTQRIDMSNMPHLSKGKMWIGKLNYLPPVITPIPTFPYVQVVGSLNWSAPGIPPGDGDAVPTEIGLNAGEIFIGDPNNTGQIITSNKLPNTVLPDLPTGNIWIGNNNRPQPYPYIDITNLPRLGYTFFPPYGGQIWRGTASGQAVVSDDLGKLELGFNIYKTITAPLAINAAIAAFHLVVLADIAAAIAAATPTIVASSVTAAATFILPIAAAAAKSYTDNQISALRLNKISADADVSLYNFKIINLADPINPLDAVNLQTMQAAISGATGGLISSVTGTVNQITANTVAGAVTLSLPSNVIISTSLTAGNLELIGNTIQSNNTNGNIILNPNGTGSIDANNHKIINLANPINPLDAVNLQTLTTAIGGTISSVTGTANQITASTVAGAVTLSLPAAVIISTSLTAGNLELIGNTLQSNNTNGNILLNPNGTGNVDVNNHRIINVGNAVGAQDAVNLQTLNAAISAILIVGTTNQITVNTVSNISTISLPASVIISTSLTAGNMQLTGNSLVSTNTNGNITLNPNGTGNVDVNNHKIINLANPTNALDAVNLQTLNAAIGTGGISSVSGTTNQITATTVSGAVTLSLPSAVIISTSLQAGNMQLTGNSLVSTNTNGSISITPNGSGNLLLIPSPSTGNVGIKGTPSYPLDVFGAMRTQRIIGSTAATATAGVASVTGTGSTITIFGSELGGIVDLNTGTGITTAGTTNPIITVTFASAMPSTNYAIVLSAGNLGASSLPVYAIGTTTTSFTIRCNTVLANSTSYTFHYHVIGN
jgi:hypothetical protein